METSGNNPPSPSLPPTNTTNDFMPNSKDRGSIIHFGARFLMSPCFAQEYQVHSYNFDPLLRLYKFSSLVKYTWFRVFLVLMTISALSLFIFYQTISTGLIVFMCCEMTFGFVLLLTYMDREILRLLFQKFDYWFLIGNLLMELALVYYEYFTIPYTENRPLIVDLVLTIYYVLLHWSCLSIDAMPSMAVWLKRLAVLLCIVNDIILFVIWYLTPLHAEICLWYCASTASIRSSCLSSMAAFYVKYFVRLWFFPNQFVILQSHIAYKFD